MNNQNNKQELRSEWATSPIYERPQRGLIIRVDGEEIYERCVRFHPSESLVKLALEIYSSNDNVPSTQIQDFLSDGIESVIGLMSQRYAPSCGTFDIKLIDHEQMIAPQFSKHLESHLYLSPCNENCYKKFFTDLAQELYLWIKKDAAKLRDYGLLISEEGDVILRCTPVEQLPK